MSVHLDFRNILTLCFLILLSTGPKGDFSFQVQGETDYKNIPSNLQILALPNRFYPCLENDRF